MNLYKMMKPVVFKWLKLMNDAPNKDVTKEYISPIGISYTFGIDKELATKFFNEWKKLNS